MNIRNKFEEWLVNGNVRGGSSQSILVTIDKISEYAVRRKIAMNNLWEYTHYNEFSHIYHKLCETRLLRITDRNTHKDFIIAGQLYLQFLKEKPFAYKEVVDIADEGKDIESSTKTLQTSIKVIDPNGFIAWLTTQRNANGTLYLERVAKAYTRYLKTAPSKLDIPLSKDERKVFTCTTLAKFDKLCNVFLAAPNYKMVNQNGHQSFSAGMKAYRRYLSNLEQQEDILAKVKSDKRPEREIASIASVEQLNTIIRCVDFEHTELCANCDPLTCTINNEKISIGETWRDLLMLLVEKFIVGHEDRITELSSRSLSYSGERSFLLSGKPKYAARQLSNGYWVYLNLSIPNLVDTIGKVCRYCGISLNNVEIMYAPKSIGRSILTKHYPDLLEVCEISSSNKVFENVINLLNEDFANGFRFNTTTIRLLSDKMEINLDNNLQAKLKQMMFHRNDDVYFLPDMICDLETREIITSFADKWLDEYGFFEISELYNLFADNLNNRCIYSSEHFEAFYKFINMHVRDMRCVGCFGTRIARMNKSVNDLLFTEIATQIIDITNGEYGGTINEDDLRDHFSAFSVTLLANIIKEHAEELIKTEINGIVCYQTLDSLGLSDEFSDTLAEVLDQIAEVGLTPNEEVLHTALSIRLGVNFKAEYNIPDGKTYRRLIAAYYKGAPRREWKRSIFSEA